MRVDGWIIFISLSLIPEVSTSELLLRAGGKLVYDTETNLTWLADANYANTIAYNPDGFIVPGYMTKDTAQGWVSSFEYAGLDNWRLPDTLQPDLSCSVQGPNGASTSYGCVGSELGRMFYILLGGTTLNPISSVHNNNYDLFININDDFGYYWANPESVTLSRSWAFRFDMGYQNRENKTVHSSVWPVREGDPLVEQMPDGDANFDGVTDVVDVQIVMKIILGLRTPTAKEYLHIDIAPQLDGIAQPDGAINSGDLLLILRMALGVG